MILPIIVVVALLMTLSGALLDNARRSAAILGDEQVARYAELAGAGAVADFSAGLADYIRRNGTRGPWPAATSRSAVKPACGPDAVAAACPFSYVVSATITGASSAGTASGSDAAANVQSAAIDEQRVSAAVTATLRSQTGVLLGARTRLLTYRVFDAAPYAIVSGQRDGASIDGTQAAGPGDSGGAAAAPDETAGVADTRIHVELTCRTAIPGVVPFANDQQPAGNDGLPWGNTAGAAYEAPCAGPPVAADAFSGERWTNGDTNRSGWSP